MLTIYTNTFARPDYVQLLAWALRATTQEPYRFVVVVQPGGLRRTWDGVAEVREGTTTGYMGWRDIRAMIDGPSVILHDDCVPVLPWSSASFPGPHCQRMAGHTLEFHAEAYQPPFPMLVAARVSGPDKCPPAWPRQLCEAAVAAHAEHMAGGVFLHLDKGTIASPASAANAAKPHLVEQIAAALGIAVPEPLAPAELAAHPGRDFPARVDGPGLGDMVAAGLTALGVTKERVQRLASAVGIKDCGCSQRQEALNSLGKRLGLGGK